MKQNMSPDELSSAVATFEHIAHVRRFLGWFSRELIKRGEVHDLSKLDTPEIEAFGKTHKALSNCKFGSDEYKTLLAEIRPAIKHHQQHNSHHVEFHDIGFPGMTLLDVIEMFCDWNAAAKRNKDGNIRESIQPCCVRYQIPAALETIFQNTVTAMLEGPEADVD